MNLIMNPNALKYNLNVRKNYKYMTNLDDEEES